MWISWMLQWTIDWHATVWIVGYWESQRIHHSCQKKAVFRRAFDIGRPDELSLEMGDYRGSGLWTEIEFEFGFLPVDVWWCMWNLDSRPDMQMNHCIGIQIGVCFFLQCTASVTVSHLLYMSVQSNVVQLCVYACVCMCSPFFHHLSHQMCTLSMNYVLLKLYITVISWTHRDKSGSG